MTAGTATEGTSTLTIFCIGTGHEKGEQWNLLRALYDLTDAEEIPTVTRGDHPVAAPPPTKKTAPRSANGQYKILFDGPETFFTSNATLRRNQDFASKAISALGPGQLRLFGHSRGAVLATMIANASPKAADVRLWLLDLVTHTDWKGGFPELLPKDARTVGAHVDEVVRIVMEDEYNLPPMFPLEDVRLRSPSGGTASDTQKPWDPRLSSGGSVGKLVGGSAPFIRMPGGHGSGTQVNPLQSRGRPLGTGHIRSATPSRLWPIGEACLAHALDALDRWSVDLHDESDGFRGHAHLVECYARIRVHNARRADRRILLNDCTKSDAEATQELAYRMGQRSPVALRGFADAFENDWRFDPLIVNHQHQVLLAEQLRALSCPLLARFVSTRLAKDPLELVSSTEADAGPASLDEELRRIRTSLPFTYGIVRELVIREREVLGRAETAGGASPVDAGGADPAEDLDGIRTVEDVVDDFEGEPRSFQVAREIDLVPGVITMSTVSVEVVSTSPVRADITGTAHIGDLQLDLFLDTGSRSYDLRASAPVDPETLVGALDLGAGVGGLVVGQSRFSGSLTTGSFRASLLLEERGTGEGGGDPWGAGSIGWELSGVELELGRIGGPSPSGYAAFSATARPTGTPGSASGVVTGRYDDGAWAFTIEAHDVDSEVFGKLGWEAKMPDLALGTVLLSHDSGTRTSVVDVDVALTQGASLAGTMPDIVSALTEPVQSAELPEFLAQVTLEELSLRYERVDGATTVTARCRGRLGFGLAPSGATTAETPEVDLTITVSPERVDFAGSVLLADAELALRFSNDDNTSTVIGSYVAADDDRVATRFSADPDQPPGVPGGLALSLRDVAPAALGLPDISVTADQLLLVWHKKEATDAKILVAVSVHAGGAFDPELPVVGGMFPGDGLSLGASLVAASAAFDAADVTAVREQLPVGAVFPIPAEGTPAGLNVLAQLDIGDEPLVVGTGEPGADNGPSTQAGTDVAPPESSAAPADTTRWLQVQRSFGPVHLARVGVAFVGKRVALRLDAAITLGGVELSMLGLGVSFPLGLPDPYDEAAVPEAPSVELDGILLSFANPQVTVSGTFLRDGSQFLGKATIRTQSFTVVAFGGLSEVLDELSLFVFAALRRDFGGPPALRLTGLALGFGYNRDFLPPALPDVSSHVFLTALEEDAAPAGTSDVERIAAARTSLEALGSSVPARKGANWLAAGATFDSFGLIRTRAVALVRFGGEVEILLLGVSELTLPRGAAGAGRYVHAELALKVSVRPDAGVALAEAMLTDRSFVLDPDCRISGRFATAMWFGDHPRSGDFVVSIGGYHPRFRRPAHYPDVPRLGVSWTKGALTVKGEGYFALTPSAVMAGGQLEAAYRDGMLTASFLLSAHFLISWEPFHYDVEIGLLIRVAVQVRTVLGTVPVRASLGARVRVWGPELAGRARVSWGALSFDVEFGEHRTGPVRPPALTWSQFTGAFLPAAPSVLSIQATTGLVSEVPTAEGPTAWVVAPDALRISVRTAVPASSVVLGGGREDGSEYALGLPGLEHDTELGVQPMGRVPVTTTLTVEIRDAEDGGLVDLHSGWTHDGHLRQGVPAQLWNPTTLPASPSADMLADRVVGLGGLRPVGSTSANNPDPLSVLQIASGRPVVGTTGATSRQLPLVPGPAVDADPAVEPQVLDPSDPTRTSTTGAVFARISAVEAKDDDAHALRDAVIERAAQDGFLPDLDPTIGVTLPVLGRDVAEIFASSPMLGTGRLGGATAATAVEHAIQRPPRVDTSAPESLAAVVVRLLGDLTLRPYVESDGLSTDTATAALTEPPAAATLIVTESPRGAPTGGGTPLERRLTAGGGMVLDVSLEGAGSRPAGTVDELRLLQLDLGADETLAARVLEVDRLGAVLSDGLRSGRVDVHPRAARVAVLGVAPESGSAPGEPLRAVGWTAQSAMVRVAPNVFLVDGGVVEVQVDPGPESAVLRGGELVRSNRVADDGADTAAEAGWVRNRLPGSVETLAVRVRRTSNGAASLGSSLDVRVTSGAGDEARLVADHVLHDSDTEATLLFRVPSRLRGPGAGATLLASVQLRGGWDWELAGVLGFAAADHLVRQGWNVGATGLAPTATGEGATRTVRVVGREAA